MAFCSKWDQALSMGFSEDGNISGLSPRLSLVFQYAFKHAFKHNMHLHGKTISVVAKGIAQLFKRERREKQGLKVKNHQILF